MIIEQIVKRRFFIGTKWFWRIRHQNGQILATSEMYSSLQKMIKTSEEFGKATGIKTELIHD